MVTAVTDGLGLGFSQELASKGLNLVLVGRNEAKLMKTAESLKEKYQVQVVWVVKDFEESSSDPVHFFQDLFNQISSIPVSMLVNNVGGSHVKLFVESKKIHSILNLNVFSTVFMTKLLIDKAVNGKFNFAVITVSSVASLFPGTKLVTYRAVKSFGFVFSDVLASETSYIKKKFQLSSDFLCLTPGLVDTPATLNLKSKPLMISARECAKEALNSLTLTRFTPGHWKHSVMYLLNCLVSIVEPWIGHYLIAGFEDD
jgi:short-subunit dehydrogenase